MRLSLKLEFIRSLCEDMIADEELHRENEGYVRAIIGNLTAILEKEEPQRKDTHENSQFH